MGGADAGMDAEAEAEAAASAVAVAAISSDESVGSTREPTISIRKTTIKNSFASVASTTNQGSISMPYLQFLLSIQSTFLPFMQNAVELV